MGNCFLSMSEVLLSNPNTLRAWREAWPRNQLRWTHVRYRRLQNAAKALGPTLHVGFACEQILPDLEFHMRNAALLAVHDDRVVAGIAHRIRLVVPDDECAIAAQPLPHQPAESRISAVQHADVPAPPFVHVDG